MVSPTKPTAVGTPAYSAVPNAEGSPTFDQSPDPNRASVGYSDNQFLSPDADTHMLRPQSGTYPAPSIISRNRDSVMGTPDNRSSWGSNAAFAAAGAGAAGRPAAARGQSNLQHESAGWNNTDDDRRLSEEDDGVGHVAPAAAAAGTGAGAAAMSEKSPRWANNGEGKSRKKLWWILGAVLLLLAAGLAIGLGVGLTRGDRATRDGTDSAAAGENQDNTDISRTSGSPSASSTSSAPTPSATSGGQGSTILLDDGTEMTYDNPYGGTWFYDPSDPYKMEAQANSWTPPLSQNWTWGIDKIYGVNVGGWLDTEPFIVPGLYEIYANGSDGQTAVDEYTLIQNMGDNATAAMTEHYETFITERDFVEMVSNGINWVRLPIGHWAVATSPEEPYLERVSWEYVLKALKWARKYGIRINFDLHTLPGSQNGWNHSGRIGPINWLRGAMGLANAQRSMEIIRTLTQFLIQPEYASLVPLWGFVNEPNANEIGQGAVGSFYYEVYRMVREITGTGEGNGPMLSMHDGFVGITSWYDFMPGADRMALDQHPYMCFGDQRLGDLADIARVPCQDWAVSTNQTSRRFGANTAGEWSAAVNDCGQWLNRVGAGARYEGAFPGYNGPTAGPGGCDYWNDHRLWDNNTKAELLNVVTRSMDALQNYFFWTWKIGNSTGPIPEPNPMWHYRLGLREGWIPSDPRTAVGACAAIGITGEEFSGTYPSAWMTGGAGANDIPASASNAYPWPPASFTNVGAAQMTLLPQYTTTGSPVTMPPATYTSPGSTETISGGNGWAVAADNQSAFVPISGCSYPPEYSAQDVQPSQGACGAGLTQQVKRAEPKRTAVPAPRPRH